MFSGGDQAKSVENGTLYFCGQAFTAADTSPNDTACPASSESEVTTAYSAVGTTPEAIANLERYVMVWYGQPYFQCLISTGISSSGVTGRSAAGNACMAEFASAAKNIRISGVDYPVFDPGPQQDSFLEWAVKNILAGVPTDVALGDELITIPPQVVEIVNEFTNGDAALNDQIFRLYREAMAQQPEDKRNVLEVQESIAHSIVDQAKAKKTSGTEDTADDMAADAFLKYLVVSYVDNVVSPAEGQFVVNMRQMPDAVVTRLSAGTSVNASDPATLGEIRRLFVQVVNEIKEDPKVSAHLEGLDAAGRTAYLDALDAKIVEKFIAPVRAKIIGKSAEQIAAELGKWDAEVDFTAADNGDVTITEIRLVQRITAEMLLPPERLVFGLGAQNDLLRFAAVARLWGEVLQETPEAAIPGSELQEGLVDNLISQLQGATTPELRTTYVISVDPAARTVELGHVPQTLLEPNSPAYSVGASDGQYIRIYTEAAEQWAEDNPDTPVDADTLGSAVRQMIRPYTLNMNPNPSGPDFWDLDTLHPESITASGSGYTVTGRVGAGAQTGGGDTVGTAQFESFALKLMGLFEGSVMAGTEGFGAYAFVRPELRFDWNTWALSLVVGGMGFAGPDSMTNCGSKSLCYENGGSSFVRLYNAYLQAAIDINGQEDAAKIAAGLIGLRGKWPTEALNYDYNNIFGMPATLGTSTGVGGRFDLKYNFGQEDHAGYTAFTAGLMLGEQMSLQADADGGDVRQGTFDIGAYTGASILLHPDSKLHLTLGLGGDYGIDGTYRITVNGGMDVQPTQHFVGAIGGFYSHATSNDQPADMDGWAAAVSLRFPFENVGDSILGITTGVTGSYGTNGMGTVNWGGQHISDTECTSISCPEPTDNSFDVGSRLFALQAFVDFIIGKHGTLGIGGIYTRPEAQDGSDATNMVGVDLHYGVNW